MEWDTSAPAELALWLKDRETKPTIWHFHGKIDNVSNIILTPDGYQRLYSAEPTSGDQHQAALTTLQHQLALRTFLFVGFSLNDQNFGVVLRGVSDLFQGHTGPHFALIHRSDAEAFRAAKLPIEPLVYQDHGVDLPALLRKLASFSKGVNSLPIFADAPIQQSPLDGSGAIELRVPHDLPGKITQPDSQKRRASRSQGRRPGAQLVIPEKVLKKIRENAQLSHPGDYSTQKYVISEQTKDYLQFEVFEAPGIPDDILTLIVEGARRSHSGDYSTALYVANEQVKDWHLLQSLDVIDLPKNVLSQILHTAASSHPGDFSTQLYVVQQQIEDWRSLNIDD